MSIAISKCEEVYQVLSKTYVPTLKKSYEKYQRDQRNVWKMEKINLRIPIYIDQITNGLVHIKRHVLVNEYKYICTFK